MSIAISGCGNNQLLNNVQIYEKNRCLNQSTSDAQYADCMKRPNKTYQEYQKERNELIEDKAK